MGGVGSAKLVRTTDPRSMPAICASAPFGRQHAFRRHVHRDRQRRPVCSLGPPRLQQEQLPGLDCELEVLCVAEQRLQRSTDIVQPRPHGRQGETQPLVVRQVSPSGHDVLALSVKLEVEIEFARPRGGVAGEAHPGARRAAGIAEDHCLHRDSRAGCVVDPVQASITDRLLRVPGPQYGLGGGEKLHAGIGGKGLPRQVTVARQHRTGQCAQIAMVQFTLALYLGRRNRCRD